MVWIDVRPGEGSEVLEKMTTFDDFLTTFDDLLTMLVAGAQRLPATGFVRYQRVADRCGNEMKGYWKLFRIKEL